MHLSAEDQRHVKAAEGWLVLGNLVEAHKELDGIEPAHRVHPDVLQLRWLVHSKAENWIACLEIAETLIKTVPDRRFGWVHKAFSLEKLGRSDQARRTLRETVERFKAPHYLPDEDARPGIREEAASPVTGRYSLSRHQRNISPSRRLNVHQRNALLLVAGLICLLVIFESARSAAGIPTVLEFIGRLVSALRGVV